MNLRYTQEEVDARISQGQHPKFLLEKPIRRWCHFVNKKYRRKKEMRLV